MLLTIDIGNTNISYGLFKGKTLIRQGKVPVQLKNYLQRLLRLPFKEVEAIIISSVVPRILKRLKTELSQKFSGKFLILGENIFVPIRNLYKSPQEVGQDRLVNAYAGYRLYGGGLIIVDFGTAVTFDVISKKGEYLGGMIFPGLSISLEALCQRAVLLPKRMELLPPAQLIGRSTKQSICSGIYYGFASLTYCLVNKIRQEQGRELKVIITGGDAQKIYPFFRDLGALRPDLTLQGLMLIGENLRKIER